MTIDARFVILWDFGFKKKGRGNSHFREIRAIVPKLYTNISIKELVPVALHFAYV